VCVCVCVNLCVCVCVHEQNICSASKLNSLLPKAHQAPNLSSSAFCLQLKRVLVVAISVSRPAC
jgi:hypothetical protein